MKALISILVLVAIAGAALLYMKSKQTPAALPGKTAASTSSLPKLILSQTATPPLIRTEVSSSTQPSLTGQLNNTERIFRQSVMI